MKLALVGDVMLGRLVNRDLATAPPPRPWGDTLGILAEADARICNLECVFSNRGIRARKAFTFRSDEKNVAVLEAARIDAVSLANNHVLDFGPEALADTLRLLDRSGIAHAGAGFSLGEAQAPARVRAGPLAISLLSVTDNEPEWEATERGAGTWYVPADRSSSRAAALFQAVDAAKRGSDLIVVSAHWGTNWGYEPEPGHREFAHALVDAGADVVFGHSCHVTRGIERHRGGVILYATGDFIDDYMVHEIEPNDESFVFVLEYDGRDLARIRLHPVIIGGFRAMRAAGPRRDAAVARMVSLCRRLDTHAEWDGEAVLVAEPRAGITSAPCGNGGS